MLDRNTKLKIAGQAANLHRSLGQRDDAKRTGRLDVYHAIQACGIPLLFRPLDGLLGAFLVDPGPGILVTTGRPDPIQRFTAAHELGHAILKHKPSLDDESIIRRIANPTMQRGLRQEEEANFFATTFLLPAWLVNHHAGRQGWKKTDLADPFMLYQLSLRVGMSYQATCVALRQRDLLNERQAASALAVPRKTLKKELLGVVEPESYRRNVWILTPNDSGSHIQLRSGDYTIIELPEQSGGGYQWDTNALDGTNAAIVHDERAVADPTLVGSPVVRRITVRWEDVPDNRLVLNHQRPWEGPGSATSDFQISTSPSGQSRSGVSDQLRRRQLEAA